MDQQLEADIVTDNVAIKRKVFESDDIVDKPPPQQQQEKIATKRSKLDDNLETEIQSDVNKCQLNKLTEVNCDVNGGDNNVVHSNEPHEMASFRYPQIGKPAPQFKGTAVINGQFKDVSLSDYKGKYVVLFFYPLDFTFVCPTEIIGFSERAEDFSKLNTQLIAASTDSHYTHLAWINTPRKEGGLGSLNIPLLADKNAKISQDYGVYLEDAGVPLRGLFIIDDKQNLRQITINDLPVGRSVDETLRLVQAFQYTDVHGEVCPVGWKPGDATIKPSVDASKEFFSKKN